MKERPIIMCASNVLAILNDHKSVTRRVMKPQPIQSTANVPVESEGGVWFPEDMDTWPWPCLRGDLYWVRETWKPHLCGERDSEQVHYRADGDFCLRYGELIRCWKSPIFMPRWASRITLRVKSVRPEQLGQMTANEARKEGVSTKREFWQLWETIHGKKARNPDLWVWRTEFEKVKP